MDPVDTATDSVPEAPDANMELGTLTIEDEGEHDETPAKPEPEIREELEEEPEKQAQNKTAASPSSPSRTTLAKAVRLGMEDDEIADYDTEADLLKAIKLVERRKAVSEDSGEQKKPAAPDVKRIKIDDISDLNAEKYDDDIVKVFGALKGLAKQESERADRLEKQIEQLVEVHQHSSQTALHNRFDSAVEGLRKSDLFGEGVVDDLEDDTHRANRVKLFQAREDLVQGMRKRGEKVPSEKKLVEKAYRMAFGETIKADVRKDFAGNVQKRSNMITRPPTQRHGADAADSTGRAVKSVAAKLADLGKV